MQDSEVQVFGFVFQSSLPNPARRFTSAAESQVQGVQISSRKLLLCPLHGLSSPVMWGELEDRLSTVSLYFPKCSKPTLSDSQLKTLEMPDT